MEKRNKIELTERFRQTGATTELVAKFFGDENSILIVQNQMMRSCIIENHLNCHDKILEDLSNRVLFYNANNFDEMLNKYDTWYLDVCTDKVTKKVITLALDKNKTLVGHYAGNELNGEQL